MSVALTEGRALGLPVIGEHDELVWTRCVLARPVDHSEALVELAEGLERVRPLEPGVMRHLVVARERRIHGGHPAKHVLEDGEDDEIAHPYAHPGAQEWVGASSVATRVHVPPPLPLRGHELQPDLPEHQHERPSDVRSVREEGAVTGIRSLLLGQPAYREDRGVRVPESRLPRLVPPLDSSPAPVVRSCSIAAQSSGLEQLTSRPDALSTHRNAGMSSLFPSRIPAWLAPVCEERSVSHSSSRCVPRATQRAMFGVVPSRIARWSTGSASPSISRHTIPAASVAIGFAARRATRRATRSV